MPHELITHLHQTEHGHEMRVLLPGAEEPIVAASDWFGPKKKKFQFLIYETQAHEPALSIRFNDDGTLHSILVPREHLDKVSGEHGADPSWSTERDGGPDRDGEHESR